ncbi:MAG: hypothetical protein R3D25_01800 [Geminicoccaceae bacterium]
MTKMTAASTSLLGLCSFTGALLAGSTLAQPTTPDIGELLDPARVAASACGGLRYAKNELFKPGVQLAALARPAAAAEMAHPAPLPILDGLGPDRLQATTTSDEACAWPPRAMPGSWASTTGSPPSTSARPRRPI